MTLPSWFGSENAGKRFPDAASMARPFRGAGGGAPRVSSAPGSSKPAASGASAPSRQASSPAPADRRLGSPHDEPTAPARREPPREGAPPPPGGPARLGRARGDRGADRGDGR